MRSGAVHLLFQECLECAPESTIHSDTTQSCLKIQESITMSLLDSQSFNFGCIAASLFCLIGFHIIVYADTLLKKSSSTQLSRNIRNSIRWLLKHREKTDAPSVTLAVQTFRNTILVAVFVGGNALSLAFDYSNNYTFDDPIASSRSIILAVLLFCSFLCWACVIRFASHLGYLVGTLGQHEEMGNTPDIRQMAVATDLEAVVSDDVEHAKTRDEFLIECARIMTLNMLCFSLGFRFMFISLPFAFLSMGGLALIIATAVMLLFLYFYDYGFRSIGDHFASFH